ncbi:MAG: YbjN domain-containing protein [Deltaproteobacteria bacterium]|nr:YbjN domain-containing protein [Deltaproteobacteria bacterium]
MRAPTGTLGCFADLVAAVAAQGLPHRAVAPQVEVQVHRPPVVGAITLIWSAQVPTVQLLHVIAHPPANRPALLDAIARINHALPRPGFGLAPDGDALYFRLVLARRRGTDDLAAAAIGPALTAVIDAVAAFAPVLAEVARGARPADQAVRARPAQATGAAFDWIVE